MNLDHDLVVSYEQFCLTNYAKRVVLERNLDRRVEPIGRTPNNSDQDLE